MSSPELPKHIGSWNDVVAWVNHLQRRIGKMESSIPPEWRINSIQDRLDMQTFRWVEADLAEVLLEEGDEEGPEYSMRWSDFEPHLHEIVHSWNLSILDARKLVEALALVPKYHRGAIYAERRGGGYRVLTDLVPAGGSE